MRSTFTVLRSVVSTLLIQGSGAFLLRTEHRAFSPNNFGDLHGFVLIRLIGGSLAQNVHLAVV